jgi:hypothetical protein
VNQFTQGNSPHRHGFRRSAQLLRHVATRRNALVRSRLSALHGLAGVPLVRFRAQLSPEALCSFPQSTGSLGAHGRMPIIGWMAN